MNNVHVANSITRDNSPQPKQVARHSDAFEAQLFEGYSTAIASGDRNAIASAWRQYIAVAVSDPKVRASIPAPTDFARAVWHGARCMITPAEIEAEQSLLGAILINGDALDRVTRIVTADDFAEPVHKTLFSAMVDASERRTAITPKLLAAQLGAVGQADLGGASVNQYIARLAAEATTVINARDFAMHIRDRADRRRAVDVADTVRALADNAGVDTYDAITGAIDQLDGLLADRPGASSRPLTLEQAAHLALENMTAALQANGKIVGISTGLRDLDDHIGGLRRGELVILAGRPGAGKSALAVSIAVNCARAGHQVELFSMEMTAEAIADRAMADRLWQHSPATRLAYSDIARGRLTNPQAERVVHVGREFRDLPLRIDTQFGLTIAQIGARCRKRKTALERQGKALDLVIVDHLHIARASDRYAGSPTHEISEISAGLKSLAKDLDVAILALAQLNRAVENRDNKRPQLSDLRESGSIEQDADLVLLLYREGYYLERARFDDPATDQKRVARLAEVENLIEIDIAKARNGPTGTVRLFCDMGSNAFRDLDRRCA